jgi:hypothetical protein
LNCRKLGLKDFNILERPLNNFLFIIIIAAEFVAQWAMIEFAGVIPIVGKIFRTTPLPFSMILTSVLLGAGSLLVSIILKATPE